MVDPPLGGFFDGRAEIFLLSIGGITVGQAVVPPLGSGKNLVRKRQTRIILMMRKQIILTALFGFVLAVVAAKPVVAAVNCTTQYGGGQTCVRTAEILVNKKVWDPVNKVFRDNLAASVKAFRAGEEVAFTIEVKNVGDDTLHNVKFSDTLPSFLVWSGGDPLNFTIGDMLPTAAVTRTIKAKVIDQPGNRCGLNVVVATSNEGTDRDTAQVCVGQPPKEVPQAGPEMGILALLPAVGALGFFLHRKV